jgi:CheY-like chemotaxis protein
MDDRRQVYRALVIEDDPVVQRLICTVLEREGFVVEGVRNGAQAIQLLNVIPYELLIIDLMLPVLNGEAVLIHLHQTRPESLRRVIVTTASPRLLDGEFLQRVCKLLEKPFDVERLVTYARECVVQAA